MGERGHGHSSLDLRRWAGAYPIVEPLDVVEPSILLQTSREEGILWFLFQATVLFVKESVKIIMRIAERIVVWHVFLI